MNHIDEKTPNKEVVIPIRKPYHKPLLEELGDLRTMTLGGSPGIGDFSGDPNFTAPLPPF
jgi:hypothetical protein